MEKNMSNQSKTQDPKELEARPPFPEQEQEPVGLESEMEPRPDYGEESYRGSGKLEGKAAVITGGDSGIGRAVALAFAREGRTSLSPTSRPRSLMPRKRREWSRSRGRGVYGYPGTSAKRRSATG